jgi:predicted transcriptional regulator
MSQDKPPLCDTCGVPLTVNHTIIECQKYQHFRNQFHISEQICQALDPNPLDVRNLILFLKKLQLYNLI